MADFKPLLYTAVFFVFIGLLIPFVLGFFIDVDNIQTSPLVNNMTTIVDQGFELSTIPFVDFDNFNINPFAWLGPNIKNAFVDSITYLGLFPDWLITAIVILASISLIYTVVSLVRGT